MNQVIQALPAEVRERWCARGQQVDLRSGEVICTDIGTLEHLYLPTTAILSWNKLLENGNTTQLVMVGKEGSLGMSRLLGHLAPNTSITIAQCPGQAWRVPIAVAREDHDNLPDVRTILQRQLPIAFRQMSQLAICNRFHTLEQQLCRLLLMTHDRLDSPLLPMTHEHMASLLGVRREGVSVAAARLAYADLIDYARGHILLLDRAGLAQRACECYGVIHGDEAPRTLAQG